MVYTDVVPATVEASVTLPAPSLIFNQTISASAVQTAGSLPAPSLRKDLEILEPSAVTASVLLPEHEVELFHTMRGTRVRAYWVQEPSVFTEYINRIFIPE